MVQGLGFCLCIFSFWPKIDSSRLWICLRVSFRVVVSSHLHFCCCYFICGQRQSCNSVLKKAVLELHRIILSPHPCSSQFLCCSVTLDTKGKGLSSANSENWEVSLSPALVCALGGHFWQRLEPKVWLCFSLSGESTMLLQVLCGKPGIFTAIGGIWTVWKAEFGLFAELFFVVWISLYSHWNIAAMRMTCKSGKKGQLLWQEELLFV